jgi:hypothetical protein
MTRVVKRTSAGGAQWVIPSLISLPIFVVGFAALGAGPLGLILWPFWAWGLKLAVKEEVDQKFLPEMRDGLANEGFRQGGRDVTVRGSDWSDAVIPLPRHLTTRYTLEDEDED